MKEWILLNEQEYENVWDRFYDEFAFNPNIDGEQSFKFSCPYITYDLPNYFEGKWTDDDDYIFDHILLKALILCTEKHEYIYALDWHHNSYWMNPSLNLNLNEKDHQWKIPFFPDGDYYFFLQKDFKWGYLGHPWEKVIYIFGEELIKNFKELRASRLKKTNEKV
ncbi:DUF2716 domain-containing protein [Bacillus sp. FSL M7-0996]|uniref:DUF2716 domain-containing protein n=1 Tax=Bacillus sp. FSL M7-0996 TaxID=2921538 RepID=UPI0030F5DF97